VVSRQVTGSDRSSHERFPIGTANDESFLVEEALTVRAHGSIDAPILATPHLIFMLEDTCVSAVKPLLVNDEITVGTAVHVDHVAAAYVGQEVVVRVELVSVRGRRLVFRVEGRCGKSVIGRGLHERAIVNGAKFGLAQ
jgi:fluoroacetyl-CoA thioesterase